MVQPLHIRGAQVWDGRETVQRDLYTDGDRIAAAPVNGAQVIDLDGYTIFPGLINAHDHLELNHYPRSKFRERYDNARQWHEDMNVRLNDEPYKSLRAYPLWDKLFIGGLKNLLCGATTVAHHNPPHKDLWRKDFPVRVLKNYGWSHSFYLSTDEEIQRSYQSTPKDWPWFIHLAEGTDDVAADEYQRLKALGCVGQNTVIVHGVGTTQNDTWKFGEYSRGLIWCPSTNYFLLHKTANVPLWEAAAGNIALGSDSRLTSKGDLLDEMRFAHSHCEIKFKAVWELVTWRAALVIGSSESGNLGDNSFADFTIINNDIMFWNFSQFDTRLITRSEFSLVVKGGIPQIGDPELMAKFPDVQTVAGTLDGKPKAIHIELAKRIHANALKEPGLEVESLPKRKLFQFI